MNKLKLAPVVLFTYARPKHTIKTVESLIKNLNAINTEIFVYIDFPRNETDVTPNEEVINYIESIEGFKSVNIIKRTENFGLAKNIIEGVSEVLLKHERVIVLEDDMVTSPYFLDFMNQGLDKYSDQESVWHISGWNYPIDDSDLLDAFFWRGMNCWGWATWKNRWDKFKKDPGDILDNWSADMINRFNLDGHHNFYSQVIGNHKGKINTWAIFWYATIFENDGLCVSPAVGYIENIGHDGSGVHCGSIDIYKTTLNRAKASRWPRDLQENTIALGRIKSFYKETELSISQKVISKVKKLLL
jgi:hypothetical protein